MNRYRFRLQSVLKYRESIEDNKKRELGATLSHLRHEENLMENINNSIDELDKEREYKSSGSINVRTLVNGYNYSRTLQQKKNDQQKAIENAQKSVEIKRNELSEATKRKKILEKLREKKVEEYNTQVSREEQSLIDDTAAMRFIDPSRTKE